jgi:hypothetical protein
VGKPRAAAAGRRCGCLWGGGGGGADTLPGLDAPACVGMRSG